MASAAVAVRVKPLLSVSSFHFSQLPTKKIPILPSATVKMSASIATESSSSPSKIIDSHLHVWATPREAADKFPYFPGNEPTLQGDVDFLLKSIQSAAHLTNSMEEAGVDGALIVQPINHKFDHSLVTSVLKKYPSKFVGCLLANPAEDGSGIKQLEDLILKDGYRAVRFNPYIWPSGQKGINVHFSEIEELCSEFPLTPVIIDHVGFCKPPENNDENEAFSDLLKLSKFPQVYVKFSALFRVTRKPHPYEDTSYLLSHVLSSYGSKRVMWGSDFPYVVPECGYKGGKEAVSHVANLVRLPSADLEWIMGKTVMQLFPNSWNAA
ncbi:uncharacterized protein LOC131246719 isoform X3 [Magnolia sinica]|uniref:uncharacterized protein LOC131246719 isoform X3 n=1 Tax=Magnolia sinica TaxID=86752 RepID=UPI0026593988|nr:uncharacterized protein LOC131246719 isoform X3 [Magnolia sinica]